MPDDEVLKMYRITKTVYEMLWDRGYLVTDEDLNLELDRFKETKCFPGDDGKWNLIGGEDLFILAWHKDRSNEGIFVAFARNEEKLSLQDIQSYYRKMHQANAKNGILVLRAPMTPQGKSGLAAMQTQGFNFQCFNENELVVNRSKHELVPKHEPLTDEQKRSYLKVNKINEADLPRIQMADPMACYLGLRKGQVVKITRPSETAGKYITYRLCV
eukprot:TRINITY_DN68062_c5_g6_i1.p1 TRINITY_DN68062_c5_g6~~TRINITY_DN68062_c5_g6_i1.p1  ORF type:complete len:215 (+),score=14.84 TRINITY_DN68062_c5_g6_i1:57-701(+)